MGPNTDTCGTPHMVSNIQLRSAVGEHDEEILVLNFYRKTEAASVSKCRKVKFLLFLVAAARTALGPSNERIRFNCGSILKAGTHYCS